MKNKILNEVNKVYKKEHPSFYTKITKKNLSELIIAREKLLLSLKLPKKIFQNSSLLDLGSGSGIYSLIYNHFGAKTDLVEYEKSFTNQSKNLFKKFSKNHNYKIINSDIFKYKTNKKFEIVIFNGVAHHTQNPKKILNNACKFLNKKGFLIYGIGNKAGFFQRALQRLILYKISTNEKDIIHNAKILFKKHLHRARKFGGRSINQIIFDTYINPKIDCQSTKEITEIFKKNKMILYSAFPELNYNNLFLKESIKNYRNFNLDKNQNKNKKNIYLSEHDWLTNSNFFNYVKSKNKINKIDILKDILTSEVNDKNFENFKINYKKISKVAKEYKKNIKYLNKINFFDQNYQMNFLQEIIELFELLNNSNCNLKKVHNFLNKTKFIFQGTVGIGMNYYVGYKL